MKKLLFLLIIIVITISCRQSPQSSVQSGNFTVEFLFENNGCKVYRFIDGGRAVYYTDCTGRTEYQYQQSKSTHYIENSTSSKQ